MSRARFYVEENGCGGYVTRDRKDGDRVVASSAFEEFCHKAVSRLMGWTDWEVAEAYRYYGVKSTPAKAPSRPPCRVVKRGLPDGRDR